MIVKPGYLSNKAKGSYEDVRRKRMEHNESILNSLGIKDLSKSVFGSKKHAKNRTANAEKETIRNDSGGEEFLLPDDEEMLNSCSDNDDSSRTTMKKKQSLGPSAKKKGGSDSHILRKSHRIEESGCSPMPMVVAQTSQLPTSPTEQLQQMAENIEKKRVRGPTLGKNIDKVRKSLAQPIEVTINRDTMTIEGKHATSVSNAIGENIRSNAPVRDIGWKKIDFGIRESIILRVGQTFALGDYKNDMVIRRTIDFKAQALYADWKCKLHKYYLGLKIKKITNIKSHALLPCKPEDWAFMIDNVWETEDWKERSKKGEKARSFLKYNHTSGSQSFAARASMFVKKNNKVQNLPERFKDTHIRHRLGSENEIWIHDNAKTHHDEIVAKIAEQSQPDITSPQSEVQISIDVLGKRSGYLKGYGIHINTNSYNIHQVMPDPHVVALQQQVASQANTIEKFQNMILMLAMQSGINPASIPGLVPNSENEDGTSGREQDVVNFD